jgi:hypothetical protein
MPPSGGRAILGRTPRRQTVATIRESEIKLVMHAVDVLSNIEAQDRSLVLDMSQTMLDDLIDNGRLQPMSNYSRFIDCCDDILETEQLLAKMESSS